MISSMYSLYTLSLNQGCFYCESFGQVNRDPRELSDDELLAG